MATWLPGLPACVGASDRLLINRDVLLRPLPRSIRTAIWQKGGRFLAQHASYLRDFNQPSPVDLLRTRTGCAARCPACGGDRQQRSVTISFVLHRVVVAGV
jgi:hypothetical protein